MYSKSDLIRHIKALGIKPTDTIMVHTSLKSIGVIEPEGKTTAEVCIDALRECVSEGLLLIPAHTWATVRNEGQEFDVRTSLPNIGAVPTVAVKLAEAAHDAGQTDCIRSLHPTHSVVAFGKRAAAYVAGDTFAQTPAPRSDVSASCSKKMQKFFWLVSIRAGTHSSMLWMNIWTFQTGSGIRLSA